MANEKPYKQLEELRRELEKVDHAIGDAYDYLDRGMPDDEQYSKTWEEIEAWKDEKLTLGGQLSAQVSELRESAPEVVEAWVDAHQEVYRRVRARYEGDNPPTVPAAEDAFIIADHAIKSWEEIRAGQGYYFWTNRYLMREHMDVVAEVFGF